MFEIPTNLRCIGIYLALIAIQPTLAQQAVATDPSEAMLRADAAQHPLEEGVIRIRAVVRDGAEPPAESALDVYVQGEGRVLCVFREGKMRDRRILIREDLGKVWLFTPGSSRAIPITASQILLGGASIADVARRRLAGNYDAVTRPEVELVEGARCRVLDLEARDRKMTYASAVWWVGESDGLPRRARLSLHSGKVSKELRFLEYSDEGDGPRLRRLEIDHLLRKERGMLTTLEFVEYEARELEPSFFDPDRVREALQDSGTTSEVKQAD